MEQRERGVAGSEPLSRLVDASSDLHEVLRNGVGVDSWGQRIGSGVRRSTAVGAALLCGVFRVRWFSPTRGGPGVYRETLGLRHRSIALSRGDCGVSRYQLGR